MRLRSTTPKLKKRLCLRGKKEYKLDYIRRTWKDCKKRNNGRATTRRSDQQGSAPRAEAAGGTFMICVTNVTIPPLSTHWSFQTQQPQWAYCKCQMGAFQHQKKTYFSLNLRRF